MTDRRPSLLVFSSLSHEWWSDTFRDKDAIRLVLPFLALSNFSFFPMRLQTNHAATIHKLQGKSKTNALMAPMHPFVLLEYAQLPFLATCEPALEIKGHLISLVKYLTTLYLLTFMCVKTHQLQQPSVWTSKEILITFFQYLHAIYEDIYLYFVGEIDNSHPQDLQKWDQKKDAWVYRWKQQIRKYFWCCNCIKIFSIRSREA